MFSADQSSPQIAAASKSHELEPFDLAAGLSTLFRRKRDSPTDIADMHFHPLGTK